MKHFSLVLLVILAACSSSPPRQNRAAVSPKCSEVAEYQRKIELAAVADKEAREISDRSPSPENGQRVQHTTVEWAAAEADLYAAKYDCEHGKR